MRTFRGPLRWSPLPPPPSTCPLIIIVVVGVALSRAAWSGLVSCCAPHSHSSTARGRRTECRHAGHAISSLPFQILIKHWLRRLRTALLSSSSLLVLSMAAAAIIFCSKTKRETLGLRFMLPPVLSLTVHPSSYCSHSAWTWTWSSPRADVPRVFLLSDKLTCEPILTSLTTANQRHPTILRTVSPELAAHSSSKQPPWRFLPLLALSYLCYYICCPIPIPPTDRPLLASLPYYLLLRIIIFLVGCGVGWFEARLFFCPVGTTCH